MQLNTNAPRAGKSTTLLQPPSGAVTLKRSTCAMVVKSSTQMKTSQKNAAQSRRIAMRRTDSGYIVLYSAMITGILLCATWLAQ